MTRKAVVMFRNAVVAHAATQYLQERLGTAAPDDRIASPPPEGDAGPPLTSRIMIERSPSMTIAMRTTRVIRSVLAAAAIVALLGLPGAGPLEAGAQEMADPSASVAASLQQGASLEAVVPTAASSAPSCGSMALGREVFLPARCLP